MKHVVVALMSGGKDSTYSMLECVDQGHDIVALANLAPSDRAAGQTVHLVIGAWFCRTLICCSPTADETDSYMFQTIGHDVIENIARCMDLPLFRRSIR